MNILEHISNKLLEETEAGTYKDVNSFRDKIKLDIDTGLHTFLTDCLKDPLLREKD